MEIQTLQNLKQEIVGSEKLVLVEFWGSWCPVCQRMKEIIEGLERDQGEQVKVLRVNPDMNPSFSSEFKIRGLPTFIFFRDGKEIRREVGAKSKDGLLQIIKDILDEE